tara:strand:- start:169 stop:378 length:210 start_codon:yes stop_codon:yes gene_type:complete
MYTVKNYQTKKALKADVLAGEYVKTWQPGLFQSLAAMNGSATLEGPHFPEPHRWYAQVELRDGIVVKVK